MRLHCQRCRASVEHGPLAEQPAIEQDAGGDAAVAFASSTIEDYYDGLGADLGNTCETAVPPVVPTTIISLLHYFYESVIADDSTFGTYCRAKLSDTCMAKYRGRRRDLFPLPLMRATAQPPTLEMDEVLFLNICSLVVLSLNCGMNVHLCHALPRSMGHQVRLRPKSTGTSNQVSCACSVA